MLLAETRLRNGRLHPGAICDGCFQQIYGVMHLCRVCPNYCLCSECKDNEVHKEHDMVGKHPPHGTRDMYTGMYFLRHRVLPLFTYSNLLGNTGHATEITVHISPRHFSPHLAPLCSTRTHLNEETQSLLCQPT